MASDTLVNIKEEVTCPICLELLTEPLSLDCGHSFCQACITLNYESTKSQKEKANCPVCRVSYQFKDLRHNRLVANVVERLKASQLNPQQKQQKEYHCARHGEKLQLFCEEDRMVICWLCERSQEHRGHQIFLLEEVAQQYKVKLQEVLQKLMADEKALEDWKDVIQKERTYWENQMEDEEQRVLRTFELLRDILNSEKKGELQKLKQEKEDILNSLEESENDLAQQNQLVRGLISDLESRLEGSAMEMLQEVEQEKLIILLLKGNTLPLKVEGLPNITTVTENLTLKKPKTFPKAQRQAFQDFDLRAVLHVYQELTEARRYWVRVTPVPSKNQHITIIEDQRTIRYEDQRRDFQVPFSVSYNSVLGSPVISSGKHYWEVDVTMKSAWILGLNDGTCLQIPSTRYDKGNPSFSFKHSGFSFGNSSTFAIPLFTTPSQYWVIGMQNSHTYNAYNGCPFSPESRPLILCPTRPLHRVGVFVDYEARTLSFYNVTNNGALIYRFSNCFFTRQVYPYFNPMLCPEPMTVC